MNALPGLGHYLLAEGTTTRFREAGDLTLDLFHHDGRVEDRWLGLQPREFAILWRLAERPGALVADTALTADLLRVRFGCELGDIADQVRRLADKLAGFGLAGLIAARPEGGYQLAVRAVPGVIPAARLS
ncbi:hypothetical protein ACLBKU_03170 [Erythrobacter sp. NE805]|uniref:hypothetical protein n=1 Tax=Erythrobacter sp. NE805 TaxID=3389875 RepID=UPI00396B112C